LAALRPQTRGSGLIGASRMRREPTGKRHRIRTARIVDNLTAHAIGRVAETWSRAESDGAVTDGSDLDPERGPEDERTIAGERVRTFQTTKHLAPCLDLN
jgi:hypothetical protein